MDIRRNDFNNSLANEIYDHLDVEDGRQKSVPTLVLYDAQGLRLFEEITYLDEYYLTEAEIEVLKANAADIVGRVPRNAQLVELGSGFVPSPEARKLRVKSQRVFS